MPARPTLPADDLKERIDAVEDARDRIYEAMEEIRTACRDALGDSARRRLDRGVLAHIETSLSNDHTFLGGNMFTLEDTINELRAAARPPCPECGGTEFEQPAEAPHIVVCVDCEAVQ